VLFDVRRPYGGADDSWRITAARGVTSVEGLYRLKVNASDGVRRAQPDDHR
jgi:hypothetical protein